MRTQTTSNITAFGTIQMFEVQQNLLYEGKEK